MPLHRLGEPHRTRSFRRPHLRFDGRLNRFIADGHSKPLLELHPLRPEPYLIGMFLGGPTRR